MDGTGKWDSVQDLAKVPLQSISWGDEGLSLDFYSAVPTFRKDGNYIALLANFTFPLWDRLQKGCEGNRLLCSGAHRSHQAECSSTNLGNGDVTGILVMQNRCFQVKAFQVKR